MRRFNKGFVVAAAAVSLLGLTFTGRAEDAARSPQAVPFQAAPFKVAQGFGLPPADVGGRDTSRSPAGQDEASLLVRVERLEGQIRQLNGQLEQMQFENHRLEEQLKKFQQDVDFRFQEGGGRAKPQKRSDLDAPTQTAIQSSETASQTTPPTVPPRANHRADAFDPNTDPDAPGAPRPLGSASATNLPPSTLPAPLPNGPGRQVMDEGDPSAPLELSSSPDRQRPPSPEPHLSSPVGVNQAAPLTTPGGTIIANAAPNTAPVNGVKEEFDLAVGYLKQKEYDSAEKSLSAFLQKNPKSRYTAEAIYDLGETYYLRGRQREAAEQYLKISTDYANSARAPEALLRLGQSLHALGAKEQACASFSEVGRKYPNASAAIKAAAEREAKRFQC